MPDNTDYAQLLPCDGLSLPLSAGIVRVPAGETTWGHNHLEQETFIVMAGTGEIDCGTGKQAVGEGDVVVVAPLTHHSFTNIASTGDLVLLDFYWTDPAAVQDLRKECMLDPAYLLFVSDSSKKANPFLISVVERFLLRQGVLMGRSSSAQIPDLVNKLRQRGCLTEDGQVNLEPHRSLLVKAIDRIAASASVRSGIAEALQGPLPTIPIDAYRELPADAQGTFVWFFEKEEIHRYGIVLPILLQLLDMRLPSVLHALDAPRSSVSETPTTWTDWTRDIAADFELMNFGKVPEAGRWSAHHLAAFADLDSLARQAFRALDPKSLSLKAYLRTLEVIIPRTRELIEAVPLAEGTETFESETRTTLVLAVAAIRQLGILSAPAFPEFGASIANALGFSLDATPWSQALELPTPGTEVDWKLLDLESARRPKETTV